MERGLGTPAVVCGPCLAVGPGPRRASALWSAWVPQACSLPFSPPRAPYPHPRRRGLALRPPACLGSLHPGTSPTSHGPRQGGRSPEWLCLLGVCPIPTRTLTKSLTLTRPNTQLHRTAPTPAAPQAPTPRTGASSPSKAWSNQPTTPEATGLATTGPGSWGGWPPVPVPRLS
ncbi:unnamed protein product [Gulo gulo]|uniref:Uncharacterized protein n=1 Tax=Gulo gulo TaxID=48420 RepID=A0A9X9LTA4_GULGU|nr:unnamed protein product [Gulo gulo]